MRSVDDALERMRRFFGSGEISKFELMWSESRQRYEADAGPAGHGYTVTDETDLLVVFHWTLPPEAVFEWHYHPFHELLTVYHGALLIEAAGAESSWTIDAGDSASFAPYQRHRVTAGPEGSTYWVTFWPAPDLTLIGGPSNTKSGG